MFTRSESVAGRVRLLAALVAGAGLVSACNPGSDIPTCSSCTASAWSAVSGSITSSTGIAVFGANIFIRVPPDRYPSAYLATNSQTDENGNFAVAISRVGTVPNLPSVDTLTVRVVGLYPQPGGQSKGDSVNVLVRFGPTDQQPPTHADVVLHIDM